MTRVFGMLAAAGLCALLAPGCGSSSDVTEASCSSCQETFTEADCKAFGDAAGCEVSKLGSGSCASCTFESCDSPPECGSGSGPDPDAGNTSDAAVDPACTTAPDGLFSSQPPCEDFGTIMINGQTSYVCNCGGACPCNFECGSIDLPSGGTVGSVCAPPP